ncbi:MAG: DM13 domain-containing protein [Ilumatobacteraceae bacterium]
MTETSSPPQAEYHGEPEHESVARTLIGRISRLEIIVFGVIAAVMFALVLLEPDILEAPFENERTLLFTIGGTVLAAIAFGAMLWFKVPPVVRVVVLVVPFLIVNWWLISPYFIDDVVDEEFSTSIAEQQTSTGDAVVVPVEPATEGDVATDEVPAADPDPAPAAEEPAVEEAPPAPTAPVLLGAGQFVGLAGHDGVGDAGIFQNPDGTLTLRFENFNIDNGPDLEVYLVPGADQTSLADGSIHLGALKGNIGDQNYELAAGSVPAGTYTALVWCEAFSVEFVGATITV